MNEYINQLLFGFYPYLVIAVFFTGTIVSYRKGQQEWTAASSQFLSGGKAFRLSNNFFHVTIILLFFNHIIGLLTPEKVYDHFINPDTKALLAKTFGGSVGIVCFLAMTQLVWRRFTDPRIKTVKSKMDNVMLLLLYGELVLGLLTIPYSMLHPQEKGLEALALWTQHIATFHVGAAGFVMNQGIIFKLHLFLGMTIFLIFPFTHLIHVLTIPVSFIFRKSQQIVRRKGG